MKKLLLAIALVLCIALCLVLASCGGSNLDNDGDNGNESSTPGGNGGVGDTGNSSNGGEGGNGESVNNGSGTTDNSENYEGTGNSSTQGSVTSGDITDSSQEEEKPDESHEHSYGEWQITKDPTCTEVGKEEQSCSCGDTKSKEIPPTGHKYVGGYCSVCEEKEPVSEGLEYTLSEDGKSYIVSGMGTCTDAELHIPNIYEGLPVTSIGSSAFSGCTSLTSITISENITSIGFYAFYDCVNLTSIEIPSSVTNIDDRVFYFCYKLIIYCEAQSKPSGWGSDWNYSRCPVVWNCNNNDVANDGYIYTVIDGVRYSIKNNVATIVKQLRNIKVGDIVIPASTSYKGVSYPVTSIGSYAFSGGDSLTSIEIPGSVTSIGESVFSGCTSLTSITIPNSVTSIGEYAFSGCTSLTEINFNATAMADLDQGNNVFSYAGKNGKGITVNIGSNVTKIPSCLFRPRYSASSYTPKITSVIFEENSVCTSIGEYAFADCTSLTNVTIGDNVAGIGDGAFYNCTSLKHNEYDNGCYLGNEENPYLILMKAKDASITSCEINENTKVIYSEAFEDCTSLEYNEYDNGCYLGNEENPYLILVKAKDTSITSCEINESTGFIQPYAFSNCASLTSVTIPEGVTNIGEYAFSGCTNLMSATIGEDVTSIGENAFRSCTSLTSVTFENPNGWKCMSPTTTGETSISSSDLSDASIAAKYLIYNYNSYNWKRG